MKRHFCTLFDRNYLCRGLALYRSLARHCPDFVLHILCMDELSLELLRSLALPSAALIPLSDFEDAELLRIKPSRGPGEYCWTCTPSLPLYVLDHVPEADQVTYLDADLFFFSSPEPVFAEARAASITVHEHRFAAPVAYLQAETGRFNVGWVGFRRDDEGLACLRRWRAQCLEWCFARFEDGKFGDQKYLDEWPTVHERLHIVTNKGVGLGPWNVARHRVRARGGRVVVDDDEVVFFHFHSFKLCTDLTSVFGPEMYDFAIRGKVARLIYAPYAQAMVSALQEVRALSPAFAHGLDAPVAPRRRGLRARAVQLVRSALEAPRVRDALRRTTSAIDLLLEGRNPYLASTRWDYQRPVVEPHLRDGDVVLDVGSGHEPCPRARILAEAFPDHTLHRAASLVEDRPVVVCQVERLPFLRGSFDFALCSHVLEHVGSPGRAAAELSRVARAGFVETPAYGKDILVGSGDQHRWQVIEFEGELFFFEYSARQRQAHTMSPAQALWMSEVRHPWQQFFFERQDVFNALLVWKGELRVREHRRDAGASAPLAEWRPVAEERLPATPCLLSAEELALLEARLATPDGQRPMTFSRERSAFVADGCVYPVRGRRVYCELMVEENDRSR